MLIATVQLKVYACLAPTDMRKSFEGLIGIVETQLGKQLEDGHLFLFFNKRRDRLKVLFFTGDGTVILYKRLERGTFEPLRAKSDSQSTSPASNVDCLTLSIDDLRLLLEGIELSSVKRRARWRRESSSSTKSTAPALTLATKCL